MNPAPEPARDLGGALGEAVRVMDRLRSPGGCPWDAAQTHASLAPYLVEETYEALDAVAADDPVALREELGDVLLQVLFHARIATERAAGGFGIDDVAGDLVAKLTRRHPHVFGAGSADVTVAGVAAVAGGDAGVAGAAGVAAADATVVAGVAAADATAVAAVEASWEVLKQAEKQRESVTDGVATGQPALALATALTRRAAGRPELAAIADDLAARLVPRADMAAGAGPAVEVGAELFALVGRAAALGVDPEQALRAHAMRYRAALRATEGVAP